MKKTILKKLTSIALMLVMVLTMGVSLTACGSGNGDGNVDDGKIHITFYTTQGAKLREITQEYAKKFEEMYPNVKVDGLDSSIGSYDDVRNKVSTELIAGKGPDIAYCYPDHVALYNISKSVQTLDEFIDRTDTVTAIIDGKETQVQIGLTAAEKADFIEGYWNEGKQFGDGKMYTLPFSKSTEVLYYNKTVFEKHADVIEVPTHWWCDSALGCNADCKSSMEYVCAKLKELYPNTIPLGYDSEANWFITMCEQLGTPYTSSTKGSHFLFDNAENKAWVKKFLSWYDKDYFTTEEINGGYTSDRFTSQTSFMCIGSSAGAGYQVPGKTDEKWDFEADITSIPQQNPANKKVISQGPSVCILKNGTDEEILYSWLFIKYLTTNVEFQADFSLKSGYVPVIKSVENDPVYAEEMKKANGHAYLEQLSTLRCLEQADSYYASPAFYGSSAARDEVGKLLQKVFVNGKNKSDSEKDSIINKAFLEALTTCRQAVKSN